MRFIALIFLILLLAVVGFADEKPLEKEEPVGDPSAGITLIDQAFDNVLEGRAQGVGEPGRVLPPAGLNMADLDDVTRERYLESLQEYFQYRISGYKHRKNVFEWQLYSSIIIFAVVIILVGAGIYFSWLQFRLSLQSGGTGARRQERQDATENKGTDHVVTRDVGTTELEASIKGIKVSSPVLGVVILVISLLFFYLYLVYVYPIEEIF